MTEIGSPLMFFWCSANHEEQIIVDGADALGKLL